MCANIYSTRRKLLLDCLTERGRLENRKKPDVNQSINRKSAICLNEKKGNLERWMLFQLCLIPYVPKYNIYTNMS